MIFSYSRYGFLSLDGTEAPFQNIPPSQFVVLLFCLKTSLRPYLSLCHSVSKHPSVPIRHSVILSKNIPLTLSVIMSFCLKTSLRPYPSLCYSVSKHPLVPIRHYVILSQNALLILIIRCLNRSVYTKKTGVNVDSLENNLYLCTRKIVMITGYKYPIYRVEYQRILVYMLVISERRNNIYNTKTL